MARRKVRRQTTVTVEQASTVELTKMNSKNSLEVKVRSGRELLGTLKMGKGSVEWWPRGNETNCLKKTWKNFAMLLDQEMGKQKV